MIALLLINARDQDIHFVLVNDLFIVDITQFMWCEKNFAVARRMQSREVEELAEWVGQSNEKIDLGCGRVDKEIEMAAPYLIALDPKSNSRPEVMARNTSAKTNQPGFYVGYTGNDLSGRFLTHSYYTPVVRDSRPVLVPGVSELFGDLDQPTVRAAEGFLADLVRQLGYAVTSDASLSANLNPSPDRAITIGENAASQAWLNSKFKLTDQGLFFGWQERRCITSDLKELQRKVKAIGAEYGWYIRNGRLAINRAGQIIRKLTPRGGIDKWFIYTVGIENGVILTHEPEIYFEDGSIVPRRGREITMLDRVTDLPKISPEKFKHLEPELRRLITDAALQYLADLAKESKS